jgi:hypothetical protein
LENIACGPNTYVLVALGGNILLSNDLSNWQKITTSGFGNLTAATYGAGTYVAINNQGVVITSTDAVTWSQAATIASTNEVIYARDRFVAVGAGIYTSP